MSWAAVRQALWPALNGRRARDVDDELDEEFAFHLAMLSRELREDGMGEAAAGEAAAARFGNLVRIKNECRRIALKEQIMWQRIHLAITIALALAVGALALISYSMYRRAAQERDMAMMQMVAARSHEQEARAAEQKAAAVQAFLAKMLTPPPDQPAISVQELLDRAEARLKTEFADQPDVAARIMEAIRQAREKNRSGQPFDSSKPVSP